MGHDQDVGLTQAHDQSDESWENDDALNASMQPGAVGWVNLFSCD